MADEGDTEFPVRDEQWLVRLPATWSHRGVPHQTSELGGALAKSRIAKSLLNHPATEPKVRPDCTLTSILVLIVVPLSKQKYTPPGISPITNVR